MGLSTTLFVMALLLSGKNLWFYKVLESFHCVKSDCCKPRPETWWVLFTFCPMLHNATGKKKDFGGKEGNIFGGEVQVSQLMAGLASDGALYLLCILLFHLTKESRLACPVAPRKQGEVPPLTSLRFNSFVPHILLSGLLCFISGSLRLLGNSSWASKNLLSLRSIAFHVPHLSSLPPLPPLQLTPIDHSSHCLLGE